MPEWRALQIRSRLESIANRSLNDGKIETFYPRRMVRTHRRELPYDERPYFPGYLFADLEQCSIRSILNIRGVVAVITGAAIPIAVMTELRSRADENGIIAEPMRKGALYRLQRPGTLGRLLVRLEDVDENRRARVFMRFLGLDRPAIFALSDLGEEAAPSSDAFPEQFSGA